MTLFQRALLAIAARMVPGDERSEWLAEWSAEVWYLDQSGGRGSTRFCAGAFRDAALLRLNRPVRRVELLRSPAGCLMVLGVLAGAAYAFALRSATVSGLIARQPFALRVLVLVIALAILPAAARLGLPAQPARGWALFAVKCFLVVPAVFYGVLDLAPLLGPLQGQAALVGYILAFRWALNDQRRRCPECLRLCGNPVRMGHPSYVLLDWYGTEFLCPEGHGLLHVPEHPQTSFLRDRWLRLDDSCRSLFS